MSTPLTLDLFVSSLSGRGTALPLGPQVASVLRAAGWEVTLHITGVEDDPELCAQLATSQYVGALGGDGYLSAIARGVIAAGKTLVPFPAGRGNDLCRALKIGTDPIARASKLATAYSSAQIDGIRLESDSGQTRTVFGIVSFGFDAEANRIANAAQRIRNGSLSYVYGALRALLSFRPQPLSATVDEAAIDLGGWLTSVSNSGWFGGGINLVPASDLRDGKLEVVHVATMPLAKVIPILMKVLVNRSQHPAVKVSSASSIRITEPAGLQAMADGDHAGLTPLTITAAPGVLTVIL